MHTLWPSLREQYVMPQSEHSKGTFPELNNSPPKTGVLKGYYIGASNLGHSSLVAGHMICFLKPV
eukprot:1142859-Pelagomonas_calceolata.AAC.2